MNPRNTNARARGGASAGSAAPSTAAPATAAAAAAASSASSSATSHRAPAPVPDYAEGYARAAPGSNPLIMTENPFAPIPLPSSPFAVGSGRPALPRPAPPRPATPGPSAPGPAAPRPATPGPSSSALNPSATSFVPDSSAGDDFVFPTTEQGMRDMYFPGNFTGEALPGVGIPTGNPAQAGTYGAPAQLGLGPLQQAMEEAVPQQEMPNYEASYLVAGRAFNPNPELQSLPAAGASVPHPARERADGQLFRFQLMDDQGTTEHLSTQPFLLPANIDLNKLRWFASNRIFGMVLSHAYFGMNPNKAVAFTHSRCPLCQQGWHAELHWPVVLQCGHIVGEVCIVNHIYQTYNQQENRPRAWNCPCGFDRCGKDIQPFVAYRRMLANKMFNSVMFAALEGGLALERVWHYYSSDPDAKVYVDEDIFLDAGFMEQKDIWMLGSFPDTPYLLLKAVTRLREFQPDCVIWAFHDTLKTHNNKAFPLKQFENLMRCRMYLRIKDLRWKEHCESNGIDAAAYPPWAVDSCRAEVVGKPEEEEPVRVYVNRFTARSFTRARIVQKIAF